MNKEIELIGQRVTYTLHQRKNTKRMWLRIRADGSLTVSAPRRLREDKIDDFIKIKSQWIITRLNYYKNNPTLTLTVPKAERPKHIRGALELANSRLAFFNEFYRFKYSKISIRNQKTRWGSCSKSGNLSFNFRISLLPIKLADYIIVHELCHIGELNHSKEYWQLVAKTIPNHHEIRKELNGICLR